MVILANYSDIEKQNKAKIKKKTQNIMAMMKFCKEVS